MTELLTALSVGAGNGAIYALLALGFVIIYKAMGVISFAQPAFMMSGAVLVSYLAKDIGFAAAVIVGTIAIALVALVVERVAIRPMVGKAVFVIAIITIGIDIIVRVFASAFIGTDPLNLGDPWGLDSFNVGGVIIEHRHIAAVLATAVIVGLLLLFFKLTPLGLAMRASALDQEAAMAQGVNVGTVFAVSWALAGGLAAVAGVFAAAGNPVTNSFWIIGLAALPVIILGGLESFEGAVIAGLLIGLVQSIVATYQSVWFPFLEGPVGRLVPFVVMFAVLLVRPYGLFGTKEVERV